MAQVKGIVSDVVTAAGGRWPELLAAVGIDTPRLGKHGPCPVCCDGKDRFRLDDKEGRGTFICNQCGAGDGLDLVCKVMGKTPKEAAELVAPLVGLSAGGLEPAERERIRQQQQAKAEQARKRGEQQREQAARRAAAILRDCEQGESLYLTSKGFAERLNAVNLAPIRVGDKNYPAGSVVIPLTNEVGELVNVQLIGHDGSKRYLAGGQKAGAFHCIEGGELIAIVEGYATGLSVHLATGAIVYCAMDCGNLAVVAQIARRQHPEAQILLCGDNDAHTKGNPGKAKAEQAAAAVGGLVAPKPKTPTRRKGRLARPMLCRFTRCAMTIQRTGKTCRQGLRSGRVASVCGKRSGGETMPSKNWYPYPARSGCWLKPVMSMAVATAACWSGKIAWEEHANGRCLFAPWSRATVKRSSLPCWMRACRLLSWAVNVNSPSTLWLASPISGSPVWNVPAGMVMPMCCQKVR